MKFKHLLALLLAVIPLSCFSQTELNDSISFGQNKLEGISMEGVAKPDSISGVKNAETYHLEYTPALSPLFPYTLAQPLNLHIPTLHFTPGQSSLFQWNSGALVAAGSTRVFPGLMQIDSGEIGVYQSAGNFIFHAGGIVNKYGSMGFIPNTALTGASRTNSHQGCLQLYSVNIISGYLHE